MIPAMVERGDGPVILAIPHAETEMPREIAARLNAHGRMLADTDWHLGRLYDGLLPGATTVRATFHRYVIDANRDPSGASLYPGQNTTDLVPQTSFDGRPIWAHAPRPGDVAARIASFHAPYHAALRAELDRVRGRHGVAILYDCHSIRSSIPFLFDGALPDFNIGTNDGTTCAAQIEAEIRRICGEAPGFTSVTNGRFKGGWTTRRYGRPAEGVHAIQMELAQAIYLRAEAPPFTYDDAKAAHVRPHLGRILAFLASWAAQLGGRS